MPSFGEKSLEKAQMEFMKKHGGNIKRAIPRSSLFTKLSVLVYLVGHQH